MGRWPTKGELLEYYARPEVAAVFYYQARRWQVLVQMGEDILLQPNSEAEVRDTLLQTLELFSQGVGLDQKLDKYPTIHIRRQRGDEHPVELDYMIETDPQSWHQAFYEIGQAVEVLEAVGAFYQLKFSGHRSLHLIIPAEAFPQQVRGRPLNPQLEKLHKRLDAFLRVPGRIDSPIGLRAVYSTHPRSGMVSLPLYRDELAQFQPWMASIYTARVDRDWFAVPTDAVARTEALLEAVLEQPEDQPLEVEAPPVVERPVANYVEVEPLPAAQIEADLGAAEAAVRVAAARAALVQGMALSESQRQRLFTDSEGDVVWFATQAVANRAERISIEEVAGMLSHSDAYLLGVGDGLLQRCGYGPADLCTYLVGRPQIDRTTAAIAMKLADMDWPVLLALPQQLQTDSFDSWFEQVWVICGSSLWLGWNSRPEELFAGAFQRLDGFAAAESERQDRRWQLHCLQQLRFARGSKKERTEKVRKAAQALHDKGRDLRHLVEIWLENGPAGLGAAAGHILSLGLWADSAELLIGQLDKSSGKRKAAFESLLNMGPPATDALLETVQQGAPQRPLVSCMALLGKLADPRAVPLLQQKLADPRRKVQACAASVLQRVYGMEAKEN